MRDILLIVGGIALVGVAYYSYRRRQSKKGFARLKEVEEFNTLFSGVEAESVEKLTMEDVVNYFKSMYLTKDKDTPFVAHMAKNGLEYYFLATFNEDTNKIENYKLLATTSVDEKLLEILGNEKLVVIS